MFSRFPHAISQLEVKRVEFLDGISHLCLSSSCSICDGCLRSVVSVTERPICSMGLSYLLEILLGERARPMYLTKNRFDGIEARLLGRRIGLGPAYQIILVST